jgi:hypothetical protein
VNASEKKKSVSSDDSEDEFSDESSSSSSGLPKGGAYLSWQHLNYTVFNRSGLKKQPLQLLHDVSGFVKPGNMLALMVLMRVSCHCLCAIFACVFFFELHCLLTNWLNYRARRVLASRR